MVAELNLLPCPFCGGACDPEGWLGTDIGGTTMRGPECEQCGATCDTVEDWNRRAAPSSSTDELPRKMSWLDAPHDIANDHANAWAKGWNDCRAAIQAAAPAEAPTPVAWALVSPKGGIKKLAIQRQSVESRMARWLEEWPGNTPRIRPLVYGDVGTPAEDAREQQPLITINEQVEFQALLVDLLSSVRKGENLTVQSGKVQALTDYIDAERNHCRATGTDRAQAGEDA